MIKRQKKKSDTNNNQPLRRKGEWIIPFGEQCDESSQNAHKEEIGIKGKSMVELINLGARVPNGFIIHADIASYYAERGKFPADFEKELKIALQQLGDLSNTSFGDPYNPLLVSVRSSLTHMNMMPTETVLNIGLDDTGVVGLIQKSHDERFAWDCYRRLIQRFATVVHKLDHAILEACLTEFREKHFHRSNKDFTAEEIQAIIRKFKALIDNHSDRSFPQNPEKQILYSIESFINDWKKRRSNDDTNLALIVQEMVFGNRSENSATGMVTTRNKTDGMRGLDGYYIPVGQGFEHLDQTRIQRSITKVMRKKNGEELPSLEEEMPEIFAQLDEICGHTEQHYRDVQEIQFCIDKGELFILRRRRGKRTAKAAIQIAIDMVEDGLIGKSEAITRINPLSLEQLLQPMIDPNSEPNILTSATGGCPGSISGKVIFSTEDTEDLAKAGVNVIFCKPNMTRLDVHGIHAAAGLLITEDDYNSYGAIMARTLGRPCVVNTKKIKIDHKSKSLVIGKKIIREGDLITINGETGHVIEGAMQATQPEMSKNLSKLMAWADTVRRMKVLANVSGMDEIDRAISFGAEGVGLLNTEFLFEREAERKVIAKYVLTEDPEKRADLLRQLEEPLKKDLFDIFVKMDRLPITVRMLDTPPSTFLPTDEDEITALAEELNVSKVVIQHKIDRLAQENPIIGRRGSRVAVIFPNLYKALTHAVLGAAIEASIKLKHHVEPNIIVPFVSSLHEIMFIRKLIDGAGKEVTDAYGTAPQYQVGAIIEVPRATLRAESIAKYCDFMSYGTNDLTQLVFGLSQKDIEPYMQEHLRQGVFLNNPLRTLDVLGVGQLIRQCTEASRAVKPNMPFGICGHHGGDPDTIDFCEAQGFDYISCKPYLVPIARLAAAQASLKYDYANEEDV